MSELVVHCMKSDYDVYIGRGRCPKTNEFSMWGNPYKVGPHGTRDQVLEKYRQYVLSNPHLLEALPTLKGKVLGCWCFPKRCHGNILVELLEELDEKYRRNSDGSNS